MARLHYYAGYRHHHPHANHTPSSARAHHGSPTATLVRKYYVVRRTRVSSSWPQTSRPRKARGQSLGLGEKHKLALKGFASLLRTCMWNNGRTSGKLQSAVRSS
ncbi:hypothetical protein BaRGS_00028994 [Batillaria attramentaria]|uniref:Uncharacterized protein n=1 Tax=Batillaria attramentaria TaxID=370345 RepID=A0ABD0JYI3_9CAEN